MVHTYSRIWVHLIWTTKNRERILFRDRGKQLFDYLIGKGKDYGIAFEKLNIQPEHVHALIDLPTDRTVAKFMNIMKGGSSYWLNHNVFQSKFAWQRGYGAYSVSASQLDRVKHYIDNQAQHHKRQTFAEEYENWRQEYGLFDD